MPEVTWHEYTYRIWFVSEACRMVRAERVDDVTDLRDQLDDYRFVITSDLERMSPTTVAIAPKISVELIELVKTHRMIFENGETRELDA